MDGNNRPNNTYQNKGNNIVFSFLCWRCMQAIISEIPPKIKSESNILIPQCVSFHQFTFIGLYLFTVVCLQMLLDFYLMECLPIWQIWNICMWNKCRHVTCIRMYSQHTAINYLISHLLYLHVTIHQCNSNERKRSRETIMFVGSTFLSNILIIHEVISQSSRWRSLSRG